MRCSFRLCGATNATNPMTHGSSSDGCCSCRFSDSLLGMETDSFFCQLLKQLPETLFDLLGLPVAGAKAYRFDSVEVKKSFRLDGLFTSAKSHLPVYFVEVQDSGEG